MSGPAVIVPPRTMASAVDGGTRVTVLVCGANGSVGALVVKTLLRETQTKSVKAVVRSVDDLSSYAALSYCVGAEDGRGTIRPVWQSRQISFEGTREMSEYGLDRLEIVAGDLLDSQFCAEAVEGCDAVIFCAAPPSFGGSLIGGMFNKKRGSVDCEGVGLVASSLAKALGASRKIPGTNFVLLSKPQPFARGTGTPSQRRGEALLTYALPSTFVVVQSATYSGIPAENEIPEVVAVGEGIEGRRISRESLSRFLVECLQTPEYRGRTVAVAAADATVS